MYKEKWYHSAWFIALLSVTWILLPVAIFLIVHRQKEYSKAVTEWKSSGFSELKDVKAEVQRVKEENETLIQQKGVILSELNEFAPYKDDIELKQKLNKNIQELESQKSTLLDQLKEIEDYSEIETQRSVAQESVSKLTTQKQSVTEEIERLQSEIVDLEEDVLMQSFGFYEPKYGFESSEAYQNALQDIRSKQKKLVKERNATVHSLDWTIGNDKKKGREFILDSIKLTLRAFNNECDNIISKVKFNNIEASEKRIQKIFTELNKLTDMQHVTITREYLNLKLQELDLKYEFEQKKQEEKEEQAAIREQMREEAKSLKELEKAKEKVEKEEKHFQQAIEKMKIQLAESNQGEHDKLIAKLAELERQLELTQRNKEDVLFRVQNTRAGYVYIISNIGSFGENVYKIGMTRRLEPMDRVKELGDASVPFLFDVHAMVFSDDAPTLENALHKAFTHKRVNKINERKEFFNVTLDEIENVVRENHSKTVQFTKLAVAEDFRQSVQLEKEAVLV